MPLPPFPEIRTARLVVRAVAEADLADLLEVNGDDEVTRFLPYQPGAVPTMLRLAGAHGGAVRDRDAGSS